MVSTGAVGLASRIFLTVEYIVSQLEGGSTLNEPFSSLILRAGVRRVFCATGSVLITFSTVVLETLAEGRELVFRGGELSTLLLRRFAGGSKISSISTVLTDDRDEVSSSLGGDLGST
jgi:hypothetical protein